jgi:two-component system, OmpR family, sensor histidine kinase CpxA
MKTPRFPLYAKILLWFFLNLLVLGVAAVIALSFQFPLGPELLVSGDAGRRVQALTGVVREQISSEPRPEWDATLDRFSKAYQVTLLLYRNDGTQVAGKTIALPNEVNRRLTEGRGGPRRGPPPGESESFRDGPPRDRFGYPLAGGRDRLPEGAAPIRFVTRTVDPTRYWIGVAMPIPERAGRGPGTLILVSQSVQAGGLLMDFTLWIWIGLGAVVFSVIFWLPLVRNITRSLAQMNLATAQIAEGDFNVRLNQHRRDELGSLGGGINRMAARLAGFVTGQKRFLGDIAHELCSPIARMQMALGILEERANEKEKAYVEDVREEVQHMSGLVNELLSFSKAALGANKARLETVALRPLVEKAIKREAQDGTELRNEVPAELNVVAEPELIVRATSNLVRNALRYAGDAGPVTVSAQKLDETVELVVSDHGPGVPESELPKLFDPFYRVDSSRTRETGGAGLGLSIVKTCVETCRGTVVCRNRQPHGLEVVIRLNATVKPA